MSQSNGQQQQQANGHADFVPPFQVTDARPKDVGIRKLPLQGSKPFPSDGVPFHTVERSWVAYFGWGTLLVPAYR